MQKSVDDWMETVFNLSGCRDEVCYAKFIDKFILFRFKEITILKPTSYEYEYKLNYGIIIKASIMNKLYTSFMLISKCRFRLTTYS